MSMQHQGSPDAPLTGEILLTIEGTRLTSNLVPPRVSIDTTEHETVYGANGFDVPAGRHKVRVWSPWMSTAGEAETTVEVPPGGAVALFYSAPGFPGAPGRLGPEPHRRAGAGLVTAMLVIMVVLVIAALVATALLG
ncbi:hypothetical protein ACPCG0_01010 [Propionibacteriaceae bacterium Y1923]